MNSLTIWLAILGVLGGICGGMWGVYVSLKSCRSKEEKKFMAWFTAGIVFYVCAFMGTLYLAPVWLREWLFVPYMILLAVLLRMANRYQMKNFK